jgi:hypothetical protein
MVSNKEKGLGRILFKHLALPSFGSIPSRDGCSCDGCYIFICLDRPLPGALLGGLPVYSPPKTAPVLVSYGLLLRLGSGAIHLKRTFSDWFLWVLMATELPSCQNPLAPRHSD